MSTRRILGGVTALALLGGTTAALAASSPAAGTSPATSVSNTAATLNGTVNPQGSATQYAFQYGTSTAYGSETPLTNAGSGTTASPVSAAVSNLQPGTNYHFRTIAINSSGTTTGNDVTFTTTGTAPPYLPAGPAASTGPSSAVGPSGATVSGTVNPNGSATSYYFEYGPTFAYGYQTTPVQAGAGTSPVAAQATLSNLPSNTLFHYRLVATSAGGTVPGSDATFTTASAPPTSSRLALFGRTGFVSPSGVAGVLAGCLGSANCSHASLAVSWHGRSLGSRTQDVFIAAQDGGVIHVTLNSLGRSLVHSHGHLNVTMTLTGANGHSASGRYTLVQFK